MDASIERKANVLHFTSEQEAELEAVRVALTKAEKDLLEANENELPEETFRIKAEAKRKELNDLMSKFAHVSDEKGQGEGRPMERPSERQERNSEQGGRSRQHHREHGQEGDDDAAFASFSSVRRRHQPGDPQHQNAERT
jgi:hypothetical protein